MKKTLIFGSLLVCVFVSAGQGREIRMGSPEFYKALKDGPVAKFTLRIVDADGIAVSRANSQISYAMESSQWIKGLSDTNGLFSAEGRSQGETLYYVEKEGYYPTSITVKFGRQEGIVIKDGKWQPWDTTNTVVLKKIRNPVPMYAKRVETFLPSLSGEGVGYDLMVGDWVSPYGKGEKGDFVFKIMRRRVPSWADFDALLSLKYSNEKDGVRKRECAVECGSTFPWAYNASEDGYSGSLQVSVGYTPGKGYFETNESAACYFRIRTVTNEQGGVVSSRYGKMPEPIKFDVRDTKTGWLKFTYYLNPTPNDRNMEFDPKRNLMKNLKSTEQVNMP